MLINVPDSLALEMQNAIDITGGTFSELVVSAINRYLVELDDIEAAKLALEEYEREGGTPWKQVKQELGLD